MVGQAREGDSGSESLVEAVAGQAREGDSGSLSLFCLQFMMSLALFPPRPAKATVDLSPSSAAT